MHKTTLWFLAIRKIVFFLVCLLVSLNSYPQYTTHNVAPVPWDYFSEVNDFFITKESNSGGTVTVKKESEKLLPNLTSINSSSIVYRFLGNFSNNFFLGSNTILSLIFSLGITCLIFLFCFITIKKTFFKLKPYIINVYSFVAYRFLSKVFVNYGNQLLYCLFVFLPNKDSLNTLKVIETNNRFLKINSSFSFFLI